MLVATAGILILAVFSTSCQEKNDDSLRDGVGSGEEGGGSRVSGQLLSGFEGVDFRVYFSSSILCRVVSIDPKQKVFSTESS